MTEENEATANGNDTEPLTEQELNALGEALTDFLSQCRSDEEILTEEAQLPELTLPQIAMLLRVTPRRVNQLAADGWLPKPRKVGRNAYYPLVACVHGYIDFLKGF